MYPIRIASERLRFCMKEASEKKVYAALQDLMEKYPEGVVASELALHLDLSRNVISHYLNRLMEKYLVEKIGTKPIYWKPMNFNASESPMLWNPVNSEVSESDEIPVDPFGSLVGWNGSLGEVVEQCKAAVKYPNNGLPIIITGQSGVGKSHLAKIIYSYAISQKIIPEATPFVTFNCADYANNPQLLSAVLFGYKKGAFTGAALDHDGILKTANNGFFFLDEVHRLSYENQEKLYVVMDQGWYRPLGENSSTIHVNIRFIFATTEDINTVLLETFRRRITVKVNIIPYGRRPLSEKFEIIRNFYAREAENIQKEIEVSSDVLTILCYSLFEGNVGMLQNIIKLSCANALVNRLDKNTIVIDAKNINEDSIQFKDGNYRFNKPLIIAKNSSRNDYGIADIKNIAESFLSDVSNLQSQNQLYALGLKFSQMMEKLKSSETPRKNPYSVLFVSLCRSVFQQYGIQFEVKEYEWAILCHQYCMRSSNLDVKAFKRTIQRYHPRALYVAGKLANEIRNISTTINEDLFLVLMFFLISPRIVEDISLQGLIVAHGERTATSIANVANNLCGTFIFEAFDMPMTTSVRDLIEKVNQYIRNIDTYQGLILLVDMGSLSQMYSSIKNNIKGDLLIINNVSTSIAVDIGLKIKDRSKFRDIAEYSINGYKCESQYYEGIASGENIIISCISGIGIANKIKAILDEYIDHELLEIVTMDYRSLRQALNQKESNDFRNTKLIITTTDINSDYGIMTLNLSDIWQPEGDNLLYASLNKYLGNNKFEKLKEELLKFFSYEGVSSKLMFLNPQVIMNEVSSVIERYENHYRLNFESFKRFNLYLHISVMIERLMVGNRDKKENFVIEETEEQLEFIKTTDDIFKDIVRKYNLRLDLYEVMLLHELLNS